jgi:hypothetical protein
MSDGNRIYACHSNEEVVDVLSHGQAVFGIAVGRVWTDTEAALSHLAPTPGHSWHRRWTDLGRHPG